MPASRALLLLAGLLPGDLSGCAMSRESLERLEAEVGARNEAAARRRGWSCDHMPTVEPDPLELGGASSRVVAADPRPRDAG